MSTRRRFLFVHQNFPGQFVHVARELARLGHEVVGLGIGGPGIPNAPDIRYYRYKPMAPKPASSVALARDHETKLARGIACAQAMERIKIEGFSPDVIVAHPGWGEALFCKDVWPLAKLVIFAEFYYGPDDSDFAFDPEFSTDSVAGRMRLRLKNTEQLQALAAADWAYSPTRWQHSRLPPEFKSKTVVLFDGIDTKAAKPDAKAQITLQRAGVTLRAGDEVLTFVNRNLEPYRGFHTFMRALPTIMKARPKAHCLIVGRDSVSYGSPPRGGGTWRDALLAEVGAQLPPDRVHFLGGLPYRAYLQVLQVSACHVYLTYPFVLSWSCLEALSAQCTLVASDTGPVREVIEDGVNGLLFDFFKPADLAARAIDVLSAPQNFRKLGLSGRQMVIDRYDLDSICLPQLTQRLLAT